jgi:predicted GTPase
VALHRADRGADVAALAALRRWSAANPANPMPPLVFVPTHADRLDPPMEWTPPYDATAGRRPKERAIRTAVAAVQAALAWPEARWVPVVAAPDREPWNLPELRAALIAMRPAAEAVRAARLRERRGRLAMAADAARSVKGVVARVTAELSRGVRPGGRGDG